MYYIQKLTVVTNQGQSITQEFTPGLNHMKGSENYPKALFFDCINYMMGQEKLRSNLQNSIKSIELIFNVEDKNVVISRTSNSTNAVVHSNVREIESGTYSVIGDGNKLSDIWLTLMGISRKTPILKDKEGNFKSLDVRDFSHIFLLNKGRLQAKDSVLSLTHGDESEIPYATLAAILYLYTGKNYDFSAEEKSKNEIKKFKDQCLKEVSKQLNQFSKIDISEGEEELKNKIQDRVEELTNVEEKICNSLSESQQLIRRMIDIENKIKNFQMVKKCSEDLESQYESDLDRIKFILEGHAYEDESTELEQELFSKEKEEVYKKAAINEMKKSEEFMKEVIMFQDDLSDEIDRLEEKRMEEFEKKNEILTDLKQNLKPELYEVRRNVGEYIVKDRIRVQRGTASWMSDILEEAYRKVEKREKSHRVTDLNKEVRKEFSVKMKNILKNMIVEFDYPHINEVCFNVEKFDMSIVNVLKKEYKKGEGKDINSLINLMVSLALQKCLREKGEYNPGFLVADMSEIHKSTNKGLYNYVLKESKKNQIILCE